MLSTTATGDAMPQGRLERLLYASVVCGSLASVAVATPLVLARAQALGAGPAWLVAIGAVPGLAGLAALAGIPTRWPARSTTLAGLALCRMLLFAALVAPLHAPAWLALPALGLLLAGQSVGLVVGGSSLAWFGRLLGPGRREELAARRSAVGLAIGFPAVLAAAALVSSDGEHGWRLLVIFATACAVTDLALLAAVPDAPDRVSTCQSAAPAGYARLWWRLHGAGAMAGAGVLPLLASWSAPAPALAAVAAAAAAGHAVGLWRSGRVSPTPTTIAAAAGRRAATLTALAITALLPLVGLPPVYAIAACVPLAALDGAAAGHAHALDVAAVYRLAGTRGAVLTALTGQARLHGGLAAMAALATAALCAPLPALAPVLILAAAIAVAVAFSRALALRPVHLPEPA